MCCLLLVSRLCCIHRRSQSGVKGAIPLQLLEHLVISCFERRFSKQNSVIRQKSNILASPNFPPQKKKLGGWLRHWLYTCHSVWFDILRTTIEFLIALVVIVSTLKCKSVFFNLFAAAEPCANVCVAHGTLCNDPSVYIAATA